MRKVLMLLAFLPLFAGAQKVTIGIYGSTGKFLSGEIGYMQGANGFFLSYGSQLNGPRGKAVEEVLSNYGRDLRGSGIQRSSFDLKYSRSLNKLLSVRVSATIGNEFAYSEYYDRRFKGGGYYVKNKSESTFGGGADLLLNLSKHFMVSLGYNSIRKAEGGLIIKL